MVPRGARFFRTEAGRYALLTIVGESRMRIETFVYGIPSKRGEQGALAQENRLPTE